MHISLDSALGRQRRLNSVGESVLQIAPNAAAAYSLRSLTGGDPKVVRVRRASDNGERDFTSSQITSGEMLRWVNVQAIKPLDIQALEADGRTGDFLIAKAAYALRSLGTRQATLAATGDTVARANDKFVAQVRRNVNGDLKSFTATEVSDGTLTSFVNESFTSSLPLDVSGSASAAYSLRNLSSTYSGNVVEVRRSSDDTTQNFTATEITDGTLLAFVGTGGSDNGHVKTWYDQSGNSRDATQATSANQPKIVNAGVLVTDRDGKLALDGKSSQLDLPESEMLSSNGSYSLFTACDIADQTSGSVDFYDLFRFISDGNGGASSARKPQVFVRKSNGTLTSSSPSHSSGGVDFSASEAGSVQLMTSIQNPALSTGNNLIFSDGVLKDSTDASTSVNNEQTLDSSESSLFISTETSVSHFLSEVIYYPSDQSDKRRAIEESISGHYGITLGSFNRDGFVKTWYDQSVTTQAGDTATGNHAVQTTAASQPKIVDAGSFLNELDFDGTDDTLAIDFGADLSQANSIFMVHQSDTTTDTKNEFFDSSGSDSPRTLLDQAGSDYRMLGASSVDTGVAVTTNKSLVFALYNGASSLFAKDGTATSALNAGTADINQNSTLGSSATRFYDGSMQEFIIYNSDQTDNRTAIEANIGEAYSITGIPAYDDEVDGFVETWYDQSGNNRPLIQTTASEQPLIVEAGTFLNGVKSNQATSNDTMQNLQVSTDGTNANFGTDDWASGASLKLGAVYVGTVPADSVVTSTQNSIIWGGSRGVGSFQEGGVSLSVIKAGTDNWRIRNERQGLSPSNMDSRVSLNTDADVVLYGTTDNREFTINVNGSGNTETESADLDVREGQALSLFGAYNGTDGRYYQRSSGGVCKECYLYAGDPVANIPALATSINEHYSIY